MIASIPVQVTPPLLKFLAKINQHTAGTLKVNSSPGPEVCTFCVRARACAYFSARTCACACAIGLTLQMPGLFLPMSLETQIQSAEPSVVKAADAWAL